MRSLLQLCAAVLMTLLLLVLVFLTMLGINRLIFESEKLLSFLAEDSAHIGETVASFFEKLASFGNGADGHKIPLFENLMKIEALRDFWENIDSIIEASDGIMVARGDLGVEVPFEELPEIQKSIIKTCMTALSLSAATALLLPAACCQLFLFGPKRTH